MKSTKITPRRGPELVREHIRKQIQEGELQPGERLPSVVELAEVFGVGRSTIREAISALKATGWLDVRHGGGTFVQAVLPDLEETAASSLFQNSESLIELLEVRKVLETGTAALAAQKRSEADLEALQALLARMTDSLASGDADEGEQADVAFHLTIAHACGNPLLVQLMESLTERLQATIRASRALWFYEEQATAARLMDEHKAIYEAIAKQDSQRAAALLELHLSKVEHVLRSKQDRRLTPP